MGKILKASEATVGCVAADCNPAHLKHRPFDSDLAHHFQSWDISRTDKNTVLRTQRSGFDSWMSHQFWKANNAADVVAQTVSERCKSLFQSQFLKSRRLELANERDC